MADGGVASVVFFTARFQPGVRAWLADVANGDRWDGGCAVWLGTAMEADNPFNTPWRREKGGLWDLGPHVVSLLWAALGPVVSVTADAGRGDLTYLVLHHGSGAASTATLTLSAPEAAGGFDLYLWGSRGRSAVPAEADDARAGAARRGHRAGRQCPVRTSQPPLRCALRPRCRARAGRRAAPARSRLEG